eukprot:gene3840-13904_t
MAYANPRDVRRILFSEYYLFNSIILLTYIWLRSKHQHDAMTFALPNVSKIFLGDYTNMFSSSKKGGSSQVFTQWEWQLFATLSATAAWRVYRASTSIDSAFATIFGYAQVFVTGMALASDFPAFMHYLLGFFLVFLLFQQPVYPGSWQDDLEALTPLSLKELIPIALNLPVYHGSWQEDIETLTPLSLKEHTLTEHIPCTQSCVVPMLLQPIYDVSWQEDIETLTPLSLKERTLTEHIPCTQSCVVPMLLQPIYDVSWQEDIETLTPLSLKERTLTEHIPCTQSCVVPMLLQPIYDGSWQEDIETLTPLSLKERTLTAGEPATIVFFHAEWNNNCRQTYSTFVELAHKYATEKIRFCRIDVGTWPQVARQQGLEVSPMSPHLPTVVMFENGEEMHRLPSTKVVSVSGGRKKGTGLRLWDMVHMFELDVRLACSGPRPSKKADKIVGYGAHVKLDVRLAALAPAPARLWDMVLMFKLDVRLACSGPPPQQDCGIWCSCLSWMYGWHALAPAPARLWDMVLMFKLDVRLACSGPPPQQDSRLWDMVLMFKLDVRLACSGPRPSRLWDMVLMLSWMYGWHALAPRPSKIVGYGAHV